MTVKAALGAEMKAHLGDVKHDPEGHHTGNSCNGYSGKTLKGNHGEVDIDVPRDRNGPLNLRSSARASAASVKKSARLTCKQCFGVKSDRLLVLI